VTAALLVPVTDAANCWVCDAVKLVVTGLTDTATVGFSVTAADAVLVGSAALAAVTVTTCWLLILDGAV
jgi:hypothetical protein